MGETPVFFEMVSGKWFLSKAKKSVIIQTSSFQSRHMTVHTIAADGFVLPPVIILRGKSNQTIKDITYEGFVIVTQEKA